LFFKRIKQHLKIKTFGNIPQCGPDSDLDRHDLLPAFELH